MSQPRPAVTSLMALAIGRRRLYLFPLRSIAYGAISLIVVFVLLLLVDRLVLGSLERGGWTSGELWVRHNKLVEENHRRKTAAEPFDLRHWSGQPLPPTEFGRRKILVLGDSYVWGPPYTTLNHLWWRQLAIELERRGYHDVDVVAAGNPGWSTRQQLECAKQLVPKIKPDFVIWGYVTNDADEKLVKQISQTQDRPPYGERMRRQLRRVLPNLVFKFESLRADKLSTQYTGPTYGYAYADWELKLLEGENFERYRQTVRDVAAFMRGVNTPALFLTLPHFPSRDYFEPRYAPVVKEWESAGLPVKNTLDEFVSRYGETSATGSESLRWGINPADAHPGPRATHFHACMAANYLEQHHPGVLGEKDQSKPHELAINDWLPFDMNVRQVSQTVFELTYSATTDMMPRRPGDEPIAMIALRYPLKLKAVYIDGPANLAFRRVWVSTLNPNERFDEDRWHPLNGIQGSENEFVLRDEVSAREVSTIRFDVRCNDNDRRLRLTIVPDEEGR